MRSLVNERLDVALGERSYPIFIGANLLDERGLLDAYVVGDQVMVVTNETVAPLYLDRVRELLTLRKVDVCIIPDGEQHKTLATYARVIDELMALRHNRTTTLVALGGGVVGDLTGFAAATYQRGVAFVQIPTTLLAQVDSSVGGKTGVNHPGGKNMIGAFYQPRCVVADTALLETLPRREFLAGVAEVVKYGAIRDREFFGWLEGNGAALVERRSDVLIHAIRVSCAIKADVVAADEREAGVRAILNFGHTFGHALEALTGYRRYLHGEAVAIGMAMASDLSARLGWLPWADARRVRDLLETCGLPARPPADIEGEALRRAMGMDKKVVDGRLRLVLIRSIGAAEATDAIDDTALRATLDAHDHLCDG